MCFFVLKSGCQWRLLPRYYGKWQGSISVLSFTHSTDGADLQEVMLDGTIVRSHACAAVYQKDGNGEQALGRSKGGFTTKIHAMVGALGNPLKFILTGGNRNEIIKAEELIEEIKNTNIIADKAYDSNKFCQKILEQNCTHDIPSRKNRNIQHEYDKHVYAERHLIECFFGKLKQFRRIFSRFDKIKYTFQAFINFASTIINLR